MLQDFEETFCRYPTVQKASEIRDTDMLHWIRTALVILFEGKENNLLMHVSAAWQERVCIIEVLSQLRQMMTAQMAKIRKHPQKKRRNPLKKERQINDSDFNKTYM